MLLPQPNHNNRRPYTYSTVPIWDILTNFLPLRMSVDDIIPTLQMDGDELPDITELVGRQEEPATTASTTTVTSSGPATSADSDEPIVIQVIPRTSPATTGGPMWHQPQPQPGPSTADCAQASQPLGTPPIGRIGTTHPGMPPQMPTIPIGIRPAAGATGPWTSTGPVIAPDPPRMPPTFHRAGAGQGGQANVSPPVTYRLMVAQLGRQMDHITTWVRRHPQYLTQERLNWLRTGSVRLRHLAQLAAEYLELSEGVHVLQTGRSRSRSPVRQAGSRSHTPDLRRQDSDRA